MRDHEYAAGECAAGGSFCGKEQCGKIVVDQRADEPQVFGAYQLSARQDADDQLL